MKYNVIRKEMKFYILVLYLTTFLLLKEINLLRIDNLDRRILYALNYIRGSER